MSLLRNIRSGVRSLFRKEQVDRELDVPRQSPWRDTVRGTPFNSGIRASHRNASRTASSYKAEGWRQGQNSSHAAACQLKCTGGRSVQFWPPAPP